MQWQSSNRHTIVCCCSVAAAAGVALEDADWATWRSPSVPRAVAERRIHPGASWHRQHRPRHSHEADMAPTLRACRLFTYRTSSICCVSASRADEADLRRLCCAADGDGLVFLDPPLNSSSYAHRQGDLAVQLPAGAHDLRLKLLRHEGFVFGTAFSPETVAGARPEAYQQL